MKSRLLFFQLPHGSTLTRLLSPQDLRTLNPLSVCVSGGWGVGREVLYRPILLLAAYRVGGVNCARQAEFR